MSEELKATIYEPSKDPRYVSRDIDPEFVPLIDRGVYFNEDGTLCDDFQTLPEDLSADESIGFHTDSVPSTSNTVPSASDTVASATVTVKCTDAVYPILQRQKKLEKQINHLEKIKSKIHLKNKLKKLRKKLKWAKESEVALLTDPESCVNPIPAANTSQPRNNLQLKKPVNSKPIPNGNPNRKPGFNQKKKKKKAPPKSPTNDAGSSQLPNPSRFPAFIRNPWMRKNPPKSAPRMSNLLANYSCDYIPIGNHNSKPRFRYNSQVPPLANTSRYFNLDNC